MLQKSSKPVEKIDIWNSILRSACGVTIILIENGLQILDKIICISQRFYTLGKR